ncbi:hypothetical protein P692DRAFT_20295822 [Suillus brevipes Sb2]|nr:hypothetical protein P692DRAFT_20295822 [Suillus brevipes Sb2]
MNIGFQSRATWADAYLVKFAYEQGHHPSGLTLPCHMRFSINTYPPVPCPLLLCQFAEYYLPLHSKVPLTRIGATLNSCFRVFQNPVVTFQGTACFRVGVQLTILNSSHQGCGLLSQRCHLPSFSSASPVIDHSLHHVSTVLESPSYVLVI